MNSKLALIATSLIGAVVLVTYFNYLAGAPALASLEDGTDLDCGFGDHFQKFLAANYSQWNFDRPDIKCGAYGGRVKAKDEIKKIPVIFIHGNSDVGFGRGTADGYVSWQTGFRSLATFLSGKGYQKQEMYTTTWGPANPNAASNNTHSKEYTLRVRAFIEAVIAYTGAEKVNVIGHSMGVTLARKALKGGSAVEQTGQTYEVGRSLKDKVHAFIGLAGANLGLVACWTASSIPTCNGKNGFFPGAAPGAAPSNYLNDLNTQGGAEAANVYTIWSKYDDLILYQCSVWGKITCRIPGQNAEVEKTTPEWGHFAVRDNTGADLIGWL